MDKNVKSLVEKLKAIINYHGGSISNYIKVREAAKDILAASPNMSPEQIRKAMRELYKLATAGWYGKAGECFSQIPFRVSFIKHFCDIPAEIDNDDKRTHVEECVKFVGSHLDRIDPNNDGLRQITLAFKNLVYKGNKFREQESDVKPKPKFNPSLGNRFKKMPKEEWLDIHKKECGDQCDARSIPTLQFLKEVFNTDVSKEHNICIAKMHAEKDPTIIKINKVSNKSVEAISKFRYVSTWLFVRSSKEQGLRRADNLIDEAAPIYRRRPYLVIETDNPELTENLNGFIRRIREFAPLVAVIDSGKKSLHYWFNTNGLSKSSYDNFKELVVTMGFDNATFSKASLVRTPNSHNDIEKDRRRQDMLYYNVHNTGLKPEVAWKWIEIKKLTGFGVKRPKEHRTQEEIIESAEDKKKLDVWVRPKGGSTTYWVKYADGSWLNLSRQDITDDLIASEGLSRVLPDNGEGLSEIGWRLKDLRINYKLNSIIDTKVAGKPKGIHEDSDGYKTLITREVTYPPYEEGHTINECPHILMVLEHVLGKTESKVLMAWLGQALRILYANGTYDVDKMSSNHVLQMIYMVGDTNMGKSFIKQRILQPLFGGQAIKGVADIIIKASQFNSAPIGLPLWVMDDDTGQGQSFGPKTKIDPEEIFKQYKKFSTGEGDDLEFKGVDKISVKHIHFMMHIMNRNELNMIPDLTNEDTAKKIILFQTKNTIDNITREQVPNIEKGDERVVTYLGRAIGDEINTFYSALIDYYPPEELKNEEARYPVVSFKDKSLLNLLKSETKSNDLEEALISASKDLLPTHIMYEEDGKCITAEIDAPEPNELFDEDIPVYENKYRELYYSLIDKGTLVPVLRMDHKKLYTLLSMANVIDSKMSETWFHKEMQKLSTYSDKVHFSYRNSIEDSGYKGSSLPSRTLPFEVVSMAGNQYKNFTIEYVKQIEVDFE